MPGSLTFGKRQSLWRAKLPLLSVATLTAKAFAHGCSKWRFSMRTPDDPEYVKDPGEPTKHERD